MICRIAGEQFNKYNIYCLLFVFYCVFFQTLLVFAEEPAEISADYLEYQSKTSTYVTRGSVKIIFQDSTLSADEMQLNSKTHEAVAVGNVVFEDAESVITADKIELNVRTKRGTTYNSYIFYKKQNFHLYGGNIEKTGARSFHLDKATVTTCDADIPDWSISAEDIKATQHKSMRGRNATFRIRNTPVLYSPYFWAPISNKRETGFLFPAYGYSSTSGHYYQQGFFWAIRENMDATFYLDYYTEKGLAEGFDYRYIVDPETTGELWMYYVRDNDPHKNLFEMKSYNKFRLPYDISSFIKLHAVSDYGYYEEIDSTSQDRVGMSSWTSDPFGFASEERLQKYLESDIQFSKNYSGGRTYILGQARQGLEESSKTVPQSFPEVGFIFNSISKGPVSFNMAVKGVNFWKKEGQYGQRIDINPNLYLSLGRRVNLTQKVGLRETAYILARPSKNENRLLFELRTALTTNFFKKYDKTIHLVEPFLEYEYVPSVDQTDIPFFDTIDSIPRKSNINYSLTNRISGLSPLNLETRFRLSQSYSLLDVENPFAPLLAEAALSSDRYTFNLNTSYDVHERIITETIASFKVKDRKGFIGFGKNFRRISSLDQITFEAGIYNPITLFKEEIPVDIRGNIWYDLNGNGVQELNIISRYVLQCWGLSVSFKKRPEEYQILFGIEFKGLGALRFGSI